MKAATLPAMKKREAAMDKKSKDAPNRSAAEKALERKIGEKRKY